MGLELTSKIQNLQNQQSIKVVTQQHGMLSSIENKPDHWTMFNSNDKLINFLQPTKITFQDLFSS